MPVHVFAGMGGSEPAAVTSKGFTLFPGPMTAPVCLSGRVWHIHTGSVRATSIPGIYQGAKRKVSVIWPRTLFVSTGILSRLLGNTVQRYNKKYVDIQQALQRSNPSSHCTITVDPAEVLQDQGPTYLVPRRHSSRDISSKSRIGRSPTGWQPKSCTQEHN